ncbi:S8 family serine peptidase [Streptomyces sp. McG3]|uniref:S8 family peptidase n=1 Tax=Streptomyces sp. McG3 TaxID=2725483 RepID=UPI0020375EE1|nr:S8 family serine peptidase [Streptomyces sp. McG3]
MTQAVATQRVVVGYKSNTQESHSDKAAAADASGKGEDVGQRLRFEQRTPTGEVVFDLGAEKPKAEVAKILAEFRSDPSVAFVEPEIIMTSLAAAADPNDTEYRKQWDLFETAGGMNVPGAWQKSTGKGVNVAVIDSGYVKHGDLGANVKGGYDFITSDTTARDGDGRDADPADEGTWGAAADCGTEKNVDSSWHGTHVAGSIAALTGNGKGIAGVAGNAEITPVRALGKCGSGSSFDIAIAMLWSAGIDIDGVPANPNPAEVVNLSLGGESNGCPVYYQRTIDRMVARGTTVVVAAGNSNVDVANATPANCNNVITVASNNREGGRAFYSNFGSKIDISAPGGETRRGTDAPGSITTPANGVLSTVNAGKTTPTGAETYAPMMGTSMAAPHIAGLAALLKSAKPGLTPAQIEETIKKNARDLPGSCTGGCGAGIADAARTIESLGTGTGTDPTTPSPRVFGSTSTLRIPDNAPAVTSTINVTGITGNAPANLKVSVDIDHQWRGDVVIDLVAPDGTVYHLKALASADSAANIKTTYTVDASAEKANGTWTLRLQDQARLITGTLSSWGLTF